MQISSLIGHTQELLGIILKSDKPADSLIDTFFRSHKYLGSHDRRFIAETSYGTLRHLRKLEYQVDAAVSGISCNIPDDDRHLFLIIAFLFNETRNDQITSDILIPKIKDNRTRENLELILTNLKRPVVIESKSVIQRIGIEYSFPDWMIEKFIAQYEESETEKICASLNKLAPLTIRVNTLKTTVEQCKEELEKLGIESERTPISPVGLILKKRLNVFSLPIFKEGWFEMQDEGSQILPLLIDPKPNAKVLDVCAGAGGKTLELAAIMKNRGEIFAADINGFRLEDLRKRAKRAGVQNVRVKEIGSADNLVDRFKGFFDIVLVDAPCSGTGTIRRNPGMKWKITEHTVDEVSEKQEAILDSSAPLVKPGGRLVYATCTLL
ncbi:MAG: methyltransferase domain-containing protein, partial [Bacteroidetes bacterium]|nr:methyltransferase domain-containing protein [Bacteroidota bacterium]